jgi:hypothetical protein
MNEDRVGESVVIEEVISLWAAAGSGSGSEAKLKSTSKAESAAADRSVRSTLPSIDGMTPKELGEFAEAEFLRTVLKMGMAVTKPWGESQGYDFIVTRRGS